MPAVSISLIPHPAHPADAISEVTFQAEAADTGLLLRYAVIGNIAQIKAPTSDGGMRRDELWTSTCFELFARRPDAIAYTEFNFAANGDWAAYAFARYRDRAPDIACAPPRIEILVETDRLVITVELSAQLHDIDWTRAALGPAVIIETLEGGRSYWALHHPADKPDFHLAQNFQLSLD